MDRPGSASCRLRLTDSLRSFEHHGRRTAELVELVFDLTMAERPDAAPAELGSSADCDLTQRDARAYLPSDEPRDSSLDAAVQR